MSNKEYIELLSHRIKGNVTTKRQGTFCTKSVGGVNYVVKFKKGYFEVIFPFPKERKAQVKFVDMNTVVQFFEDKAVVNAIMTTYGDDTAMIN